MSQQNTEFIATQTILHKGVRIPVRTPWFLRFFKKTISLTITSPYEGTMHRIANYYLSTGISIDELENITTEQALELQLKHGKAINKAIACAILNGYWSGILFTKPLAAYLRWNAKPQELFTMLSLLLLYGGVEDFMSTTKLVRTMKLSTPRMGQNQKGS